MPRRNCGTLVDFDGWGEPRKQVPHILGQPKNQVDHTTHKNNKNRSIKYWKRRIKSTDHEIPFSASSLDWKILPEGKWSCIHHLFQWVGWIIID
jgi:hypothetical protein